jgi:hypothetical protein
MDPEPRGESPLVFLGPTLMLFGFLAFVIVRSLARLDGD